MADHAELIQALPKAELHVHIEGCMPPAMVIAMAQRNGLEHKLPFRTVAEAAAAFKYESLQPFLDLRDASLQVLVTERDFTEVMAHYLTAVAAQNVKHAEIFFDPQVQTMRGVGFASFMPGLLEGMRQGAALGVSASLLMCFMTELGPAAAEATLADAAPWLEHIAGVGIARGIPNWTGGRHPHSSFKATFQRCREMGLRLTAHAGEEGPAAEMWEALRELGVDRIDHGVSCLQDRKLMQHLKATRLPLTVCPLSNYKLQVYRGQLLERMRELLAWDLMVTVNSDDPPLFGGYVNENFQFWAEQLPLSADQIYQLALNSVDASFLPPERKAQLRQELFEARRQHDARQA